MSIRDLIPWGRSQQVPIQRTRDPGDADPLLSLQRDVHSLIDSFWSDLGLHGLPGLELERSFAPAIDVTEDDEAVRVEAELPGLDREDLQLEITSRELILRGEKRSESERTAKGVRQVERRFGSFQRAVALPCEVVTDQAEATFTKGVLTVRLPKSEESRRRWHRVEVR
jgi:HSP20 family protein